MAALHNDSRQHLNNYLAQQSKLNGVPVVKGEAFTVAPSIEQRNELAIRESSGFLQKINMELVDAQEGEKIGIDTTTSIASRTDTSQNDRQTQDPTDNSATRYRCEQTEFDTHWTYAKLDAWRHRFEVQRLMAQAVTRQIALDRLKIGFNGTSVAAQSDRNANPLLQDVNIGWIKTQHNERPESVMGVDGSYAATPIKVGDETGRDYVSLDALVNDIRFSLIHESIATDLDLVVIAGFNLLQEKYQTLIEEAANTPTEKVAVDVLLANKNLGGLRAMAVSGFPANGLIVTKLKNLSIYAQRGTTRKTIIENPRRNRVEVFQSVNEAYVVEQPEAFAGCLHIQVPDGNGGWA